MGRKTPRSFLWSGGSFARTNQPASKGGVHSLFAFLIQITRIIVHALEETFLPAGYPDSVPSEYSTFQVRLRRV